MANEERTRTYSWQDPRASAAKIGEMSGLEFLRAIAAGQLPGPPIAHTLGFTLSEVSEGLAVFTVEPKEFHYNPIGVVHGGLVCTLLDSVTACAVHSTLPAGKGYTSIEIKVSYLKAVTASSGLLTATGTLVKGGSRVGFSEGVVVDESGTPVATATSSCLVFDVTG